MNLLSNAARSYYAVNVAAWRTIRRRSAVTVLLLIGAYLGITAALRSAGHPDAAWAFTAVGGVLLLTLAWQRRA